MKRSKVAGGGGTTTGGGYNLLGTMGEHDAGRMSGGGYTLTGGFSVPTFVVPDPLEAADDGLGGDYNRVGDFKMPASAGGQEVAIRVKLNRMYIDKNEDASQCPVRTGLPDLQAFEGQVRYLGPPEVFDNNSLEDPKWVGAKLQCTPHIRDWSASALAVELGISEAEAETIYYYGAPVVPCSIHAAQQGTQSCVDSANEDCFSEPLEVRTALWGDVWPDFGLVNFTDIGKIVEAFKGIPFVEGPPPSGAPNKWRAMLRDNEGAPGSKINFTDIGKVVDAFKTIAYQEDGPTDCP
ncbi:MAG: hypothetical protein IID38_10675 [Planctomycetes bacterium]|nr:hypothetical protein [Planctomycetota bacterium]